MPKDPKPPKAKQRPNIPVSRTAAIARQAANQDVGDTADKITRAPKKKR